MEFLGTERYKNGRYGWQDVSYAIVGNMFEVRKVVGSGDHWLVNRYIGMDAATLKLVADKARELSKGERKSARGHDELMAMLRPFGYASGYVAIDEIDWPTRKVTNAGGMNITPAQWQQAFNDG